MHAIHGITCFISLTIWVCCLPVLLRQPAGVMWLCSMLSFLPFWYFYLHVGGWGRLCVGVYPVCRCPRRSEEHVRSPGTTGCEPPDKSTGLQTQSLWRAAGALNWWGISLTPSFLFLSFFPLKQNHVSQAGLKLLILLLHPPPKRQGCRCEQPHITCHTLFTQIILSTIWWTLKVFPFFPW